MTFAAADRPPPRRRLRTEEDTATTATTTTITATTVGAMTIITTPTTMEVKTTLGIVATVAGAVGGETDITTTTIIIAVVTAGVETPIRWGGGVVITTTRGDIARTGTIAMMYRTPLPTALTSPNRKLGVIFLSSGAAFTVLGITLFFNKTLMRLGNILFVIGVPLLIGPGRTAGYFLQPRKARATGCLGCGIFLVLVGHPVIGILLEVFGLLNLFGNMFPLVRMMAKNLPVVGGLFGGGGGGNNGGGGGGTRKERPRYDDGYYEDEGYERESYR
ncbi:hypothetical protein ACHAXA_003504 [Cyclostephanos tholiformis]|uniref:Uncharacterized protein n=1 Tax=Cyclostephanos tholiformis TaxID=382380 RepID=A0ABD3SFR5_9STRA